jgi:hypothetical protein
VVGFPLCPLFLIRQTDESLPAFIFYGRDGQQQPSTMAPNGTSAASFYTDDKNLMKLCDFLRSSDGPAVREAIEMDKRVYYIKGAWRMTFVHALSASTTFKHACSAGTCSRLSYSHIFNLLMYYTFSQERNSLTSW